MRVLFVLSALTFLFCSGCADHGELTGPWEMWVLVSSPAGDEVWTSEEPLQRVIRWAAIPGENIRCDLFRNGEPVMEIFDWRDKSPGEFVCRMDIASAGTGEGFTIVIQDDQGFYGKSGAFTIR